LFLGALVVGLGQRVGRRAVRLICAGWLPQDGLFGWNASAALENERDQPGWLFIAVPRIVPRAAVKTITAEED
jgi:hypothetical protein